MVNSYFALGYKCNHKCLNCPLSTFDRLHGQLDSETIMKNISNLSKYGENLHITISGGEPTLSPYFLEILSILGKVGAHITILSNAVKCEDISFVDKLISSLGENYDFNKLRYVTAIHSCNPVIHDRLTGVNGSYNETIKGLQNLDKRNIHIIIKNIMNKITAPEMSKTLHVMCEILSNNMDLEYCATDYSGRCSKNIADLYINFVELQPYLEHTLDQFEKNKDNCGRVLEIIETPLCLLDPYYWKYYKASNPNLMYIAPNNECNDNISENTYSNCHTRYKECAECDVRKFCSGIWESTYNIEPNKEKIIRRVRTIK